MEEEGLLRCGGHTCALWCGEGREDGWSINHSSNCSAGRGPLWGQEVNARRGRFSFSTVTSAPPAHLPLLFIVKSPISKGREKKNDPCQFSTLAWERNWSWFSCEPLVTNESADGHMNLNILWQKSCTWVCTETFPSRISSYKNLWRKNETNEDSLKYTCTRFHLHRRRGRKKYDNNKVIYFALFAAATS